MSGERARGARLQAGGARFAVYAERADAVELALFDDAGRERRVPMRPGDDGLHTAVVDGVSAGQRYGFRVHGRYVPSEGDRFNPAKLVIDPYARAFAGKIDPRGPVVGEAAGTLGPDASDSAPFVPKSVVVDETFDWGDDAPPRVPWSEVLLYEAHVKGLTRLHPEVPERERGTYAGLASDAVLAHLRQLGVTSLELLPVHEALDELPVALRGQTNYWGYNTLGFFAPDQRLAGDPTDPVRELKRAVKRLHAAGIEVILDVVYNHSCEGDALGPTVSFRGLDNRAYYRLDADDLSRYVNWTGCGNTLDASRPEVIRLVLDSLRYWVTEMHVDGFRFDLAPALGRGRDGAFDPEAPLLAALLQDPVLSSVKLIAEPWDVGPSGYQLGRFPAPFREWNAAYRDGVRRFWNGRARSLSDMGYRLTGSSDCFAARRGPTAGINFVTAHDGFTLRDLVSYEQKHNEANGENNQDGWSDNLSLSFGVEGPSLEPAVLAARARQVRNFFATLLLAPGVPMLVAGDEMGRTQGGNNNPYVLDDATSWIDWELDGDARDLLAFVRSLADLRRQRPELRRVGFFTGEAVAGQSSQPPASSPSLTPRAPKPPRRDIVWLRPDGAEMRADDWAPIAAVAEVGAGAAGGETGATTGASAGDGAAPGAGAAPRPRPFALAAWLAGATEHVLLLNASTTSVVFHLPRAHAGWHVLVDTRSPKVPYGGTHRGGAVYELLPRSFALLESLAARP